MTGNGQVVSRVLVIEPRASLAARIVDCLRNVPGIEADSPADRDTKSVIAAIRSCHFDAVVYSPLDEGARDLVPDVKAAGEILEACADSRVRRIVLVSNAAAYGADYHNPGLIRESRPLPVRCPNRVAEAWRTVEALATRYSAECGQARLAILRPAMTRVEGASDWVNRLLRQRLAVTVAGYNPSVQLLEAEDLARAIGLAVEANAEGVFNIAPVDVVPLRQALRLARVRRVPIPWSLQRLGRAVLGRLGASSIDQQEYLRYSWTVSNERSRSELGMCYVASSIAAERAAESRLLPAATSPTQAKAEPVRFDDFGMDEHFIRVRSRRALDFMDRRYWRIEVRGLEHIPREGRAVLVGVHRGFMPFDGVMMVHMLMKHLDRIPRFLMHPGLVKFPVLAPFLTNLGGIIACQENADYVLERDEILGIFPEGIRGAFRLYRDAYTLDRFGRSDFVKMALRHRAPIVPFVFLGTAETFPILGKVKWSWWKRHTEWPFMPITPTFPLLPVPLPTKWHLQVLPPLIVPEADDPEAADDPRLERRIGDEVRDRMQRALDAMRVRRRSIFFGSIFDDAEMPEEPVGRPVLDVPLTATSRNLETTAP